MPIPKIAVTGGPAAGKTTILERLKTEFGDQILTMPEAATILLEHGFPKPGRDIEYSEDWLHATQHAVLPVTKNMEDLYMQMALRRMSRLLLCDRGLLDGAAYLGKGLQYFLDTFGLVESEVYARYTAVIHLESVAVSDPDLYEKLKSTNPARYETASEAVQRDFAIREVWRNHPNRIIIPSNGGIEAVEKRVIEVISNYLNNEIELKYILPMLPNIDLGAGMPIRQGYFSTNGEMRLRQMGSQYFVTIKSNGGLSRHECDRSIPEWAFEQQWPETAAFRVEKTRYFVPYDGLTLEIDEYHGPLAGLITLECEFADTDQAASFILPSWAVGAINVTDDKSYKNHSLALYGLPA